MNRRLFIIRSGSAILSSSALLGCASTKGDDCNGLSELDLSLCRQRAIKDSAPTYITAAMIIGAALGAGIAVAAHSDPTIGALGGALLAGGATAVERYLAYCNEKANGDRIKMLSIIRDSIEKDARLAEIVYKDSVLALAEAKRSLQNKEIDLIGNAIKLDKSRQIVSATKKNVKTLFAAVDIYQPASIKTGLIGEEQVVANIKTTRVLAKDRLENCEFCGEVFHIVM